MEWAATFSGVRKPDNIFQLIIRFYTVRIDEELDLIDQVGGCAIKGGRKAVDVLLGGQHTNKDLFPYAQLRGIIPRSQYIFNLSDKKKCPN